MRYAVQRLIPEYKDTYSTDQRLHIFKTLYLKIVDMVYGNYHGHGKVNPPRPVSIKSDSLGVNNVYELELYVFTRDELEKFKAQIEQDTLIKYHIRTDI